MSLTNLRNKKIFESWESFVDLEIINESREIYVDTIDSLIRLGKEASAEDRLQVLERYVERFNELDEKHNYFIETIEREDICEHFAEIAAVVRLEGIKECDDLSNVAREW